MVDYNSLMNWEMIGHDWAVKLLRQYVSSGQVRHAYLLTGPDGVGKRTLGLRFAQALNCESPSSPGETCGECRACRLIPQQHFPDLHVVEVGQLDQELGRTSSEILVEQVRRLRRQLVLAPYEGKWRVALLLRFGEASKGASNALLKTLEEPPPQVVLMLTARSAEPLLPTIVSRCEVIKLKTLPVTQVKDALEARGESRDRARLIAGLSDGRPGRALQLLDDPDWMEQRTESLNDLMELIKGNRSDRFAYCGNYIPRKKEPLREMRLRAIETLETWLSLWRDAMILSSGAEASIQNTDRDLDRQMMASGIELEEIVSSVQTIKRTIEAIQQYANIQLALETLMLDLPKLV